VIFTFSIVAPGELPGLQTASSQEHWLTSPNQASFDFTDDRSQ